MSSEDATMSCKYVKMSCDDNTMLSNYIKMFSEDGEMSWRASNILKYAIAFPQNLV